MEEIAAKEQPAPDTNHTDYHKRLHIIVVMLVLLVVVLGIGLFTAQQTRVIKTKTVAAPSVSPTIVPLTSKINEAETLDVPTPYPNITWIKGSAPKEYALNEINVDKEDKFLKRFTTPGGTYWTGTTPSEISVFSTTSFSTLPMYYDTAFKNAGWNPPSSHVKAGERTLTPIVADSVCESFSSYLGVKDDAYRLFTYSFKHVPCSTPSDNPRPASKSVIQYTLYVSDTFTLQDIETFYDK